MHEENVGARSSALDRNIYKGIPVALPDGNVGYVRIYSRRLLFVNRTMVSFILSVGNRQLVETRMEKETTISYNAYKKMWRKLLLAYKRKVAHGNDV